MEQHNNTPNNKIPARILSGYHPCGTIRAMSESRLNELDDQLASLGLPPGELDERFVRSSGPGGQHANKSSTAVHLRHPVSGLEVRVESERSQLQNRVEARQRLIQKVKAARAEEAKALKAAREKARRQRRQRPAGVKKKMVKNKRRRGEVKRNRRRVSPDDDS